jgi:NAD(P)-dependent dehydrogenase (short-subunit alcohol dehydrogenase family)
MANQRYISQELGGQVALVTGGGRGLGRAYAQALAQAGMAVAVTARTESDLQETVEQIEKSGGRALAIPADVTNLKTMEQLVASVEHTLGPIDLLINNAGTFRAFGLAAEVDAEEWWREVEINLRGPLHGARAVLPSMIRRKRGRLINLASGAGLGPIEGASAYAISKAALIRLSENLAIETKGQGVAVFAIDPGTVRTPMNEYVYHSEVVRQQAPHIQQWFHQLYAEKQDTPIEHSIRLVLFLASGKADTLSGRFISVDDDVNEMVRRVEEVQRADLYTLQLNKLGEV